MTKSSTMVERLVRVETKLEELSSTVGEIKASIIRMEAQQTARNDKQDERSWQMWAKIAGLSASVSLLISLLIGKVI